MGNHLSEQAAELTSPALGSAGAVAGKAVLFTRQLVKELGEGTHQCLAVPRDGQCDVDDGVWFQQNSAAGCPLRKHKQKLGSGDARMAEQPRVSRAFALEALDLFDPDLFRCPLQVGGGSLAVDEAKVSKSCPAIAATSAQECIGSLLHNPGAAASGAMLAASAACSDDLYSLTASELGSLDDLWSSSESACSDGFDAGRSIAKESGLVDHSQASSSISDPGSE